MSDLSADLAGPDPDYDADPECIDSEQASRWLRKLAQVELEQAFDDGEAERERSHIDGWHAHRSRQHERKRQWFTRALEAFWSSTPRKGKSLSLPFGVVGERAQQPEWSYSDEAAFVEWAERSAPALVRETTTKAPAKDAVKAAEKEGTLTLKDGVLVTTDGEVVPGVAVKPRPPKFYAAPATSEPF